MSLAALRPALAEIVAATGTPTFDHLPPSLQPPAYLVEPADPYLTDGETFGSWQANYLVHVIAGPAQSEVAADDLDGLIVAAVQAINGDTQWAATEVSGPQYVRLSPDRVHLGADITAVIDLHL